MATLPNVNAVSINLIRKIFHEFSLCERKKELKSETKEEKKRMKGRKEGRKRKAGEEEEEND